MSAERPTIELVDDSGDQLVLAEPSEEAVLAEYESQLDDIVAHFWRQTHELAVENAVSQVQQAQQQQAALFAVHSNAESRAHELAARQALTAAQIERALMDTRASLEQQLLDVIRTQDLRLNENTEAIHARISELIANAQAEAIATHNALSGQASQLTQFEHEVERRVQEIHEELSARIEAAGAAAPQDIGSDIRQMWHTMETQLKEGLAEIKRSLLDECVAATERRLSSKHPTRNHTRLMIDRSVNEMEERVQTNLRNAFQAARDGDRANEEILTREATAAAQEADELLEARLRAEMREAQASLQTEIRVQGTAVAALESRVGQICEELSQRINALEQGHVMPSPAHTAEPMEAQAALGDRLTRLDTRMDEMEQRLQNELKQLLLQKKRSSVRAHRSKKVSQAAALTQREVRNRSEMAARYYEMRWSTVPQEDRDLYYGEETKGEL